MKLKKLIVTILAILIAAGSVIGEYMYFTRKTTSAFEDIIVAAVDIRKGEKITQDKLALAKVAKPTLIPAAKNPAEILNKFASHDIKRGEPIIPAKLLLKPLATAGSEQYSVIVKIEPVPLTFIAKYDMVRLMFISNSVDSKTQMPKTQILDSVQVTNMFDTNFKSIDGLSQQQNAYQPINISYIEVTGNKDTVMHLKQLERTGTFIVLKDVGKNQ